MFKYSVLLIIALITLSIRVDSAEINDKFREEEIFPDVLDEVIVDLRQLNISYFTSGVNVSLGNELLPSQVTVQPDVQWEANASTFYTLLMTDPDAPSRQNATLREYRHWLVMNIDGNDVSSGDIIFEYRGSRPPIGTRLHRYVFLVFQQSTNFIDYEIVNGTLGRANTNTRSLIDEFNLTLIAGNFFQAQFEGAAGVINDKFREAEIVPDIIDEFTVELQPLNVTYISSGMTVNLGNELTPSQVRNVPEVRWEADAGAFYTLLMSDPDAPSRENPIRREVRHWLTMNINGNDITSGDVIFNYIGSGPPITTGLHRYVFLLFKQAASNLDYAAVNGTMAIINTSTRILINEFNLTLVAGNFFQAQFEGAAGVINDKFREAEIVPDIIDEFTVELQPLNVTYISSGMTVNLGNELTPSQVRNVPEVRWEADANAFYTLLMSDPDAPSRENPIRREIRHWLTMNINGNDINSGDVIFNYIGSGPPITTGLHRYVFLLFKQAASNLDYTAVNGTMAIINTSTRILINEFNLTLVAGNFFQAQFEGAAGVINDKFREAEIVPDIIDEFTVELQPLNVTYISSGMTVNLGNELTPSQVRNVPEVRWEADANAFYTLLMSDPDAPSRENPIRREIRHWLTMNINGNDINSGDVIFNYIGSGPPITTGLHRYVFLLFKQAASNLDYAAVNGTMAIINTSTRILINEFNLTLVAGNFFQAQFEGAAGVINDKFREAEIVPDIIDEFTVELQPLNVTYISSGMTVNLGNELTPSQVRNVPEVRWEADANAFYTLLMSDPDAPSRENPIRREIRHWLTMNINGNDINSGDVIFNYIGSGPPITTGLHRYVFLLFKQAASNLDYTAVNGTMAIINTSTRILINEFNLTLVAGNFFQAQFEGAAGVINDKFREAEIVPDIIDEFTVELQPLNVTYISSGMTVNLGNELTPSQVRNVPEVRWEADAGAFYTLLMSDPDAPSRDNPIRREIRHWLTMNINGNDINSGDVIFNYIGSGPPITTGLHRYVFLLFKQAASNLDYAAVNGTMAIINTSTRILINEFNLTLVAGNFFQAQFEGAAGVINDKFREAEIVPDIIDEFTVELQPLNVTYISSGMTVNLGNELTPSQVRNVPEVRWEADANAFYTLLMSDPDAPSRENPIRREIRHWLTMNINGNDINSGDVIFNYIGSGPPITTGLHRYVFLLFKQAASNLDYAAVNGTMAIINTSTRILINEFNLTLVAGNFFQAQFEGAAGVINDKFREAEIVPDIIDDFTVELQALNVTYLSSGMTVNLGNVLTPSQVRNLPEVRWEAETGTFYTLLMTDPDAPSRENPTLREVRHWLTMNINGANINSGAVICDYIGSMPPVSTGLHRYVFLLFKQATNNLDYNFVNGTTEIINTSTRILINQFNLTLVAGDFFQAEYEDEETSPAGALSINIYIILFLVFIHIFIESV